MPGDHVVMSFVAVCGQCRWCASGMEYICDAGIGTLTPGMPTDGTFRHHTTDGKPLGTSPRSAHSLNTPWCPRIHW
ncbi:alcohol dehydrogenase GroES-like domain protein [Mycobacterium xenopi 4042]|uniref:Alcohol dehydrogenase GroES-like domain protein n=1 Tax=Mycobacterium xenopi 4042 TaxID=1299334 RepID=X8E3T0_MYCXE|nr:alcohol dehydrogenase GroES-like domain protein [Mycobacterium xenopi 4042]